MLWNGNPWNTTESVLWKGNPWTTEKEIHEIPQSSPNTNHKKIYGVHSYVEETRIKI